MVPWESKGAIMVWISADGPRATSRIGFCVTCWRTWGLSMLVTLGAWWGLWGLPIVNTNAVPRGSWGSAWCTSMWSRRGRAIVSSHVVSWGPWGLATHPTLDFTKQESWREPCCTWDWNREPDHPPMEKACQGRRNQLCLLPRLLLKALPTLLCEDLSDLSSNYTHSKKTNGRVGVLMRMTHNSNHWPWSAKVHAQKTEASCSWTSTWQKNL